MKIFLTGKSSVDYVVAGLGNPGDKYRSTRHNAGFIAIDKLAEKYGVNIDKLKFSGLFTQAKIDGKKVLLVKPMTYMNKSGECISQFLKYYKVSPEKLIVMVDDISLDVGRTRIRREGTHGGHNGLKDICELLSDNKYPRIKIGIGKKPRAEMDLADWVLSKFTNDEIAELDKVSDKCADAVKLIIGGNIDEAMNRYNS